MGMSLADSLQRTTHPADAAQEGVNKVSAGGGTYGEYLKASAPRNRGRSSWTSC